MGRNIQNNYVGAYFQISEDVKQHTSRKYKQYNFSHETDKPCFLDKSIFEKNFPKELLGEKADDFTDLDDFLTDKDVSETDVQETIEKILFFYIQNNESEYLFEKNIFMPDIINIDFDFYKIMDYEGGTQILPIDCTFIENSINELKKKYKFFIDFMTEKFGNNSIEVVFGVIYYTDEIA